MCVSLSCRGRGMPQGTRRIMARETFGIVVGKHETLAFFQIMVRSEGKTPTRRATVCMWVSAAEAGKAEGRAPHVIRVRDRDLFDIVVGEEKTLAEFLLDNGGEGHRTERSGRVSASLAAAEGEGSLRNASRCGERDLGNRGWEARNSRLFSKMVRSEGHTPTRRATVYLWVSATEARKAEGKDTVCDTGERQRPF